MPDKMTDDLISREAVLTTAISAGTREVTVRVGDMYAVDGYQTHTEKVDRLDQIIDAIRAIPAAQVTLAEAAWVPEIAALIEAGKAVEEWWLREGMKNSLGAPVGMFMLRTALRAIAGSPTDAA